MEKHRLLIVDDTPANIKVLNDLLREDYAIAVATSGGQALDIITSRSTRSGLVSGAKAVSRASRPAVATDRAYSSRRMSVRP